MDDGSEFDCRPGDVSLLPQVTTLGWWEMSRRSSWISRGWSTTRSLGSRGLFIPSRTRQGQLTTGCSGRHASATAPTGALGGKESYPSLSWQKGGKDGQSDCVCTDQNRSGLLGDGRHVRFSRYWRGVGGSYFTLEAIVGPGNGPPPRSSYARRNSSIYWRESLFFGLAINRFRLLQEILFIFHEGRFIHSRTDRSLQNCSQRSPLRASSSFSKKSAIP